MGWWQVDTDTLAGSRFVISPLAETLGSLLLLHAGRVRRPGDRAFLDAWLPAYRAFVAADPAAALVLGATFRPRWIADFVVTPPTTVERSFAAEIPVIRDMPVARSRADLVEATGGPLPPAFDALDPGKIMAGVLDWVWQTVVLPDWGRRRRILEADVLARTRQLTLGGWAGAVHDLRREMRWLGGGRLQINAYDYPPRDITGTQLLFVPVTHSHGWASWDEHDLTRHALMYPASAVLADPGTAVAPPDALARLLGPVRARVLVLLDPPKSTTQLVALTGQALGSIGRHLRILHDAGLVLRRRAGRTVLYSRTEAGQVLVAAAGR